MRFRVSSDALAALRIQTRTASAACPLPLPADPLRSGAGPNRSVLRPSGPAIRSQPHFASPSSLARALVEGGAIVLCDNEDRENEGDLVFAAEHATPALVNLMIRACGGLICTALSPDLADRFRLAPMARTNACPRGTAFTVSVDAAEGITTGISARDRARTIALLGSPSTRPTDLVAPGHVFPLRARAGGLTERQGHTEAAVALAMAAGLTPAAAICEILDETGEAMRRDALLAFAARHGILIGTVAALAAWQGAAAAPRFAKVTS